MSFLSLCLRNVLRRKQRSLLTAAAVAIAVAAVVSLVGVASGFQRDFTQFFDSVGIDVLVLPEGEVLARLLDESLADRIRAIGGVVEVAPGLSDLTAFPENDLLTVPLSGLEPDTTLLKQMNVAAGRRLRRSDTDGVMLGSTLSRLLGKTAGDPIDIDGEPFRVVGVVEGANTIENGQVIMPLAKMQEHIGREGKVSGFSVFTLNGIGEAAVDRIIREIEAIDATLGAKRPADAVRNQPAVKLGLGMAWVTSAIAMVIGTLGMINTMLMSLQERVAEIGLLRAVGWRRSRIARLILGESVLLSLLGGVVGVLSALLLVDALTWLPAAQGFISGKIDLAVVLQGLGVAVGVGLFGGLMPALSATRLAPAEALRH